MPLQFKAKYFDPAKVPGATRADDDRVTVHVESDASARGGVQSYVYSRRIILAVNAALATQRPLLVMGDPGTGKTTLARNIAHVLGRKYYATVVTSRTRARDLMWSFDALRRLSDAQGEKTLLPRPAYLRPEVLWWAFDPKTAATRGASADERSKVPAALDPAGAVKAKSSVVLIDEIDKAEPDVPNDLLETLELERFVVTELDNELEVKGDRSRVLIVITTNRERELPAAFVRRCIVLSLDKPESEWEEWLVTVANERFGESDRTLHRNIAQRVMTLREQAERAGLRKPGTAEYLDTVRTCRELGIKHDSQIWRLVAQSLLWKSAAELPDETGTA